MMVGDLLKQRVLGTVALYRVVKIRWGTVTVETVQVPGLAPGQRIRLTKQSAQRLTVVTRNEARQILYGESE
jgi:hypothetical protein